MSSMLHVMYEQMFQHFGRQNWWPGDSSFEICLGAILTQNTSWSNVEKAIHRLKESELLSFEAVLNLDMAVLAEQIRPAGYFNIKAKRIKNFVAAVSERHQNFRQLSDLTTTELRSFLLQINGIGPETADSMILYAFDRPVFVVDAYTHRVLYRHGLVDEEADYYRLQEYFHDHLEENTAYFNEFHALIVAIGKKYCHKTKPDCTHCPLNGFHGLP